MALGLRRDRAAAPDRALPTGRTWRTMARWPRRGSGVPGAARTAAMDRWGDRPASVPRYGWQLRRSRAGPHRPRSGPGRRAWRTGRRGTVPPWRYLPAPVVG